MRLYLSDENNEGLTLISVAPLMGRDNRGAEVQKLDAKSNHPVWQFEVVCERESERTEVIKVRVPVAQEPSVQKYAPIRFGGFVANTWSMGDKAGTSFAAATYTQAARPSSVPPPVPKADAKAA